MFIRTAICALFAIFAFAPSAAAQGQCYGQGHGAYGPYGPGYHGQGHHGQGHYGRGHYGHGHYGPGHYGQDCYYHQDYERTVYVDEQGAPGSGVKTVQHVFRVRGNHHHGGSRTELFRTTVFEDGSVEKREFLGDGVSLKKMTSTAADGKSTYWLNVESMPRSLKVRTGDTVVFMVALNSEAARSFFALVLPNAVNHISRSAAGPAQVPDGHRSIGSYDADSKGDTRVEWIGRRTKRTTIKVQEPKGK